MKWRRRKGIYEGRDAKAEWGGGRKAVLLLSDCAVTSASFTSKTMLCGASNCERELQPIGRAGGAAATT